MGKKIGVLGAGSWGMTLATLLDTAGSNVILWEPLKENWKLLAEKRESLLYFPGFKIPSSIQVTQSIKEASENSELLIFAVRSVFLRKTAKKLRPYYENQPVVIATKGLERETGKRMSGVLGDELGSKVLFGVLSGPTIAKEVASGKPSAAVIGTVSSKLGDSFQSMFESSNLRVYTNDDIIGVEVGGSFKNVLAIGAGIIDGLALGVNTKSAYLTRGLNEMVKIGLALGAKEKTFSGLSGIGDLITTSFSRDSRNRSFGEALTKTCKSRYIRENKSVIEGIPATEAYHALSRERGIEAPITGAIYNIVCLDSDPAGEIKKLMDRQLKAE